MGRNKPITITMISLITIIYNDPYIVLSQHRININIVAMSMTHHQPAHPIQHNPINPAHLYIYRVWMIVLCGIMYCNIDSINYYIHQLWLSLQHNTYFTHDSFESILATICLFIFINILHIMKLQHSIHNTIHKYGYYNLAELYNTIYGARRHQYDTHGKLVYYDSVWHAYLPALYYVIPIWTYDYLYPRRHILISKHVNNVPTLQSTVYEIVFNLFLYDLLYYIWHRFMHSNQYLYHTIHSVHHQYKHTETQDTVRLSIIEQLIDVLISIVILNITQSHPLTRSLYNICITYLLVELHCNYDSMYMLHNLIPYNIVAGPIVHAKHHYNGRGHYAKFFTHCDKLFTKK